MKVVPSGISISINQYRALLLDVSYLHLMEENRDLIITIRVCTVKIPVDADGMAG